jgi:cytosolic carboxypeptidase protein 6
MQLPQQSRPRGLFGSRIARVRHRAAWLLAAGVCPLAMLGANPAVEVVLQDKRTWDFPGASMHFSNEFPGARLNACEQLGDARFRLVISPENTPINENPWYAFRIWADKRRTLTLYMTNSCLGHLRQPFLRQDGATWRRLPEQDYRFGPQSRTARAQLQIGPHPLWVSAVEMLGVKDLEDWMQHLSSVPFVRSTVIGKSIDGRPLAEQHGCGGS